MSSRTARGGGWPRELEYLLERHPRAQWPDARSPSVDFWLQVHDHLRRDCAALDGAGEDHRAGRSSAVQLVAIAGARLRGLVAAMQGHHQIEDFQYFPAFRHAEPRLAPGFARLESEHAALGSDVAMAETALAELRAAVEHAGAAPDPALAIAAERFVAAARSLTACLVAHLADEEDLVVPLLIEHRYR